MIYMVYSQVYIVMSVTIVMTVVNIHIVRTAINICWSMVNISGQKKRGINMGSIKNVLLHCMNNEQECKDMGMPDDGDRMINKGWIEALEYVIRNYKIEDNIIKHKQKGV